MYLETIKKTTGLKAKEKRANNIVKTNPALSKAIAKALEAKNIKTNFSIDTDIKNGADELCWCLLPIGHRGPCNPGDKE